MHDQDDTDKLVREWGANVAWSLAETKQTRGGARHERRAPRAAQRVRSSGGVQASQRWGASAALEVTNLADLQWQRIPPVPHSIGSYSAQHRILVHTAIL